ncbi:MAG: hypothetical protein Q8L26_00535 [Candidatus Omnitrophota bacterium]|nr:hypothetical protein [Candidatus Omnitrophota bacterium]
MKTNSCIILFIYVGLYYTGSILINNYSYADDNKTEPEVVYLGSGYASPFKSGLPEKQGGGDTTHPDGPDEFPLPSLTVQGVVWGGQYPQAIINNTVVKTGEKIEDVEILEIAKDKIKLLYKGRNFFIGVSAEDIGE